MNDKQNIGKQILNLLTKGFLTGDEILDQLNNLKIQQKLFYPTLSGLLRRKMICASWTHINGRHDKYFYITPKGEKNITKIDSNNSKQQIYEKDSQNKSWWFSF